MVRRGVGYLNHDGVTYVSSICNDISAAKSVGWPTITNTGGDL